MKKLFKMVVENKELEIPETWDTIKYKNPIYPSYSRGKLGGYAYCNNKYHCYGVIHSKPTYDLTPYRPMGFGFAERNRNYIPLSHVQNRSEPRTVKKLYEKQEMTKIYEEAIDTIRDKIECATEYLRKKNREDNEIRKIEGNYRNLIAMMLKYETKDLINDKDEMIGDVRYRTHKINQMVRNGQDLMAEKQTIKNLF